MPRRPEIGNVLLYPKRPLQPSDKNGYVLKFYCPIRRTRIRRNCGTRDRRKARRILRECQERLRNGEYVASGGAITESHASLLSPSLKASVVQSSDDGETWEDCYEMYRKHRSVRSRAKSLVDSLSRINIAEKVLKVILNKTGVLFVREAFTLENLEELQNRLLAGDECRRDCRSPNTVNSMIAAVMAFVRFCHKHGWIEKVPALEKLETQEVMKGRPITEAEFRRMLDAVSLVVDQEFVEEWQFGLHVLWESGFRIGELMNFSWDDEQRIHPRWGTDGAHPTIVVPPSQKNGRYQEIPMLPGLMRLLTNVPKEQRSGFVVDLRVSSKSQPRLSVDFVSRTIARFGKEAGIVVTKSDDSGQRAKHASAHDLRRGCAARLINSGISAETVKVVMRHADFATTEKHYGAIRSAQSAAQELHQTLATNAHEESLVGG